MAEIPRHNIYPGFNVCAADEGNLLFLELCCTQTCMLQTLPGLPELKENESA